MLLVGDVDFGKAADAPPVAKVATVGPGVAPRGLRAGVVGQFEPLFATKAEMVDIKDTFEQNQDQGRVTTLRNARATEAAFREQAPGHRYLHIATHGFFAPPELKSALAPGLAGKEIDPFGGRGISGWHPGLLSGIVLAGVNRTPEVGQDDGVLTALEVAELALDGVDLAVLSACQTGLGESAGGEGLLGLQRAFQVAGARTVVASLWRVNDGATQELMTRFYNNLWKEKMPKLAALREAQLWKLNEKSARGLAPEVAGEPTRVHPYYWAAFVLSGDWR